MKNIMALLPSMFVPVVAAAISAIRLKSHATTAKGNATGRLIRSQVTLTTCRATALGMSNSTGMPNSTGTSAARSNTGSRIQRLAELLTNRFSFHLDPRHAFLKESFVLIN